MAELTVKQAGKIGGLKTREKHGHDHYVEIGKAGGKETKRLLDLGKEEEKNDGGYDSP